MQPPGSLSPKSSSGRRGCLTFSWQPCWKRYWTDFLDNVPEAYPYDMLKDRLLETQTWSDQERMDVQYIKVRAYGWPEAISAVGRHVGLLLSSLLKRQAQKRPLLRVHRTLPWCQFFTIHSPGFPKDRRMLKDYLSGDRTLLCSPVYLRTIKIRQDDQQRIYRRERNSEKPFPLSDQQGSYSVEASLPHLKEIKLATAPLFVSINYRWHKYMSTFSEHR
jgi:hypothetical protein